MLIKNNCPSRYLTSIFLTSHNSASCAPVLYKWKTVRDTTGCKYSTSFFSGCSFFRTAQKLLQVEEKVYAVFWTVIFWLVFVTTLNIWKQEFLTLYSLVKELKFESKINLVFSMLYLRFFPLKYIYLLNIRSILGTFQRLLINVRSLPGYKNLHRGLNSIYFCLRIYKPSWN